MSFDNESLPNVNPLIKNNSMSSINNNSNNNYNNMNNSSDCDSLISEKDEKNKERKAFFDKVLKTKHDSKSIMSISKDLNVNILGLDGKINSILNRHHKDYISTFNEFMDTVKKDLREKIDEMEKIDKEKKKSDDVIILKTERDFFRNEAIRLNELCKELSNINEELIRENKLKATEVKHITKKWKDSENGNKQLLNELERNIKIIKSLENEKKFMNKNSIEHHSKIQNFNNLYNSFENKNNIKFSSSALINSEQNETNHRSNNLGSSVISFYNRDNFELNKMVNTNNNINLNNSSSYNIHNSSTDDIDYLNQNTNLIFDTLRDKDKIIKIVEKLKSDLKKEKNRNHKIIGEFNRILLDKKKMEKIFMDCVEESRREILHRKMRDTAITKGGFFANMNKKNPNNLPMINEIKFENFQSSDKRKLLENFLMKDEVVEFIKENLGNINIDNKSSPYFKKISLNENILKKNNLKNDTKILTINEFSKTKNTIKSHSINFSIPFSNKVNI